MKTIQTARHAAHASAHDHPGRFYAGLAVAALGTGLWLAEVARIVVAAPSLLAGFAAAAETGNGALIGLPDSRDVGAVLEWAAAHNRFVISLCHGPAAFLAVGDSDIYRGYKICAFPDSLDAQTPAIGYMPGHLTWKFGERLKALGFEIVNDGISGAVHRDRQLITGDSPLAGNALGKLAAETLLKEVTA